TRDLTMQPAWRRVTATGSYAASGTLASSTPWATAIATYKVKVPTVSSVTRADASPVDNNTDVHYTVTFSESVTSVDASDFKLTQTGSVTGSTITAVSGSGTTYTVTVHIGTGIGTVRLDVTD